ncbi:hypothetical protein ACFX2B_023320 [Malus domestica]
MRESAKEIESEKTQEENKKMEEKKKRMKERMMPPAPKPKTRTGGEKDASSHQVVQVMATLKLNQHHQEVGGSRTGRELDINRCSGDRGENERHVGYLPPHSILVVDYTGKQSKCLKRDNHWLRENHPRVDATMKKKQADTVELMRQKLRDKLGVTPLRLHAFSSWLHQLEADSPSTSDCASLPGTCSACRCNPWQESNAEAKELGLKNESYNKELGPSFFH